MLLLKCFKEGKTIKDKILILFYALVYYLSVFILKNKRKAINFVNKIYLKTFTKNLYNFCNLLFESIATTSKYYETPVTFFMSKIKGKIFIDIGAFIERYSILLSKNFEKIIAIEPIPRNYKNLVLNLRINKIENVIPLKIACYNKELELYFQDTGPTSKIVKNSKLKVKAKPLDQIIKELGIKPEEIDLIKIDVEGAELEVLEGMKEILEKGRPILVIEVNNNKIFDHIKSFGFVEKIVWKNYIVFKK